MGKFKTYIRKNLKLIILFICIIGFLEIVEDVFEYKIMAIDTLVYKIISENLISDYVTPIMKFITNFGGKIILTSFGIISLFVLKNRKLGLCAFLNLPIIAFLNQLLKHIVQRPRPIEFRIIDETGYSFPSGHSMVSAAFYGFFIYLIYKNVKNKFVKYISIIFLSLLIILIGLSRIYLGVHYASDVLAGFLISISYLIIFISVINNIVLKEKE